MTINTRVVQNQVDPAELFQFLMSVLYPVHERSFQLLKDYFNFQNSRFPQSIDERAENTKLLTLPNERSESLFVLLSKKYAVSNLYTDSLMKFPL